MLKKTALHSRHQALGAKLVDFGGWERCAIHQYTTTGTRNDMAPGGRTPQLAGVDVDYNYGWEAVGEEDAVTRTEYEDLILAVFAGSEEHADTAPYAVRSRAERLAAAMERLRLRADGQERSVADIAASAAAPAMVPAHRHEMQIAVARTGGVER